LRKQTFPQSTVRMLGTRDGNGRRGIFSVRKLDYKKDEDIVRKNKLRGDRLLRVLTLYKYGNQA